MLKEHFIKQLQTIWDDFIKLKSTSQYSDLSDLNDENVSELISKAKAAVSRIAGNESEYYKDITDVLKKTYLLEGTKMMSIYGTVKALKDDLENDYLKTVSELIHSEVFSDYLEMAQHLINEGYKDPAAVLAGSTLESHLRELAKNRNISIDIKNSKGDIVAKKADSMNSDLAKTAAYTVGFQKQITAWLDLRNNAAHGKYENYSIEQISLMVDGIRNFILQNPS
jgi:hypothetical protein